MLRPFSRARTWLAAAAAIAAMAPVLVIAAPAQADVTDGVTAWEMQGDSGDYIAGPSYYGYTPPVTAFSAQGDAGSLMISAIGPDNVHWWYGTFAAATGEVLSAGTTYTLAERAALRSAGHPGLDINGDGRGCNEVTGSFTVHELEMDAGAITRFSASWEQHCEGGSSKAVGTVLFHALNPVPLMTQAALSGPASAVPGASLTVHGHLSGLLGDVANASVEVSRSSGGTSTPLGTLVTDAGGAFSVDDTIGSTDATYTATYAGDASHQPVTRTVTIAARKLAPTLSLSVPHSDTRGHQVIVQGSLSVGGTAIADAAINVTRKDLAHTTTRVVHTTSAGAFSFPDTPAVGGSVSFTFSWAGDETRAAVKRTATMTVVRLATSLSVHATATHVVWDKSTRLTVHLGKTYNGRHVQVYARRIGTSDTSPGHLVRSGNVDSHGNFVLTRTLTGRTVFTVKFAGDYRYAPAARSITIHVAARIDLRLALYKDRSGHYYRYKNADPLAEIHVRPGLPNGCMAATAERLVSGKWREVATLSCAPVDAGSYGYLRFASARVPGSHYRMRVTGGATKTVSSGATPWLYFTFI